MPCTWLMKCATAIRLITLASRLHLALAADKASGSLVDDIDAQCPYAGDLDFDLVAALHPERRLAPRAAAAGGAGANVVAGLSQVTVERYSMMVATSKIM